VFDLQLTSGSRTTAADVIDLLAGDYPGARDRALNERGPAASLRQRFQLAASKRPPHPSWRRFRNLDSPCIIRR
jgi:hypothetical protein